MRRALIISLREDEYGRLEAAAKAAVGVVPREETFMLSLL